VTTLAISKERKQELVAQYQEWLNRSQALILVEYQGLTMKEFDALRAKMREAGAGFHIVKNTLGKLALKQAGWPVQEGQFEGDTAVVFAFEDAPSAAKAVAEFARTSEFFKVKSGYLNRQPISADGVKALAEMPPLPVMRAQLLGVLLAPAGKLVRTLAEPARSLAAVIQAHIEPAAAAN